MFNLISDSFDNYRTLLNHYGKVLGLDSKRIPRNWAATQFAEALGKAWTEYNNDRLTLIYAVWVVLLRFILEKFKHQLTYFFASIGHPVLLFWWLFNLKKEICMTNTGLSIIWRNHILFLCLLFFYHSYHQSLGLKSFSKFLPMVCWLESGKN